MNLETEAPEKKENLREEKGKNGLEMCWQT